MKKIIGYLGMLLSALSVHADNDSVIRKQFVDYFVAQSSYESSVKRNLQSIRDDGTWEDIDYTSQRRGGWPTLNHLKRVEGMAVVYADPDAQLFQSLELRDAIVGGLNHWIEKDYRNANWWNGRIGVPKTLAAAMILLGDDLPDDVLKKARPILYRSKMGQTGQNKVWCAGIALMKGLLYNDPDLMDRGVEAIWSELRVSTEEGIQPDWSFHQHGPQQQFGNYGMSFAGDMIKWGSILRDTDYELSGDKLEILRNYMLNGVSWVIWNGRMDFSGCGRQVDQGAQEQKGRYTKRQLSSMPEIDPDYSQQYNTVLKRTGFKPFWRSEMAVHRRPDWYASVKMSSERVIGAETCNDENMQGLHLADGTLLVYRDGREYEDIAPVWDWKRLPGTTCDQGFEKLVPAEADQGLGISDFSGVIGDGYTGLAAMIYKRNNLSARKSYFFLNDHLVCLGSGISGKTQGDVYTSVEQSWLKGEVKPGTGSIKHSGTTYQVIDGEPVVKTGAVEGNWRSSFSTREDRPATGEVFSLWINHGKSPKNVTYAYRIVPDLGSEEIESVVLCNTKTVQAVAAAGIIYAVFYEAGKLTIDKKQTVEADGPCFLMISKGQIITADPTHSLQTLEIKVNGKAFNVELPQGAERGKQVTVKRDEYEVGCKLPADAVITYPDSNPLRDALRPVPSTAVFRMEGWSLWDPSLIKVGDTYHLFCSRWPKADDYSFDSGWKKSHVIRATSKNLFGPYTFQEVVLHPKDHPWATQGIHNPKITKAGDRYLLYHLGIPQWSTGFAFADSIEGPWDPVTKPILKANNPALLIREDGSAYMVSKHKPKPTMDGKWDACMKAHEAADVNGPYKTLGDGRNRLPYNFELEDPTIWWANNQYNVICTDWEGKVTGIQKSVVYYTSKDGIHYELYSKQPVWTQTESILLEDGTQLKVSRIERPQVYINEKGEFCALLVAVGIEPRSHDYIVILPVDHFMPTN